MPAFALLLHPPEPLVVDPIGSPEAGSPLVRLTAHIAGVAAPRAIRREGLPHGPHPLDMLLGLLPHGPLANEIEVVARLTMAERGGLHRDPIGRIAELLKHDHTQR